MSGPNGHAHEQAGISSITAPTAEVPPAPSHFAPERVKELVAALEVPFDAWQIEWRVMNTTKNGSPQRGQVVPYADQRAYTDRLNALFTPAGWTRKYAIHTSANFERGKDQKIVAKVLMTCELTIFGVGSHSATGEQWADDPNAGTAAEAQAFKRAAVCFGLGRYLYYFTGTWVDLDEHKRPRSVPQLGGWATPEGWGQGLRPHLLSDQKTTELEAARDGRNGDDGRLRNDHLLGAIEDMERAVGKRMYRGILKTVARVWNPVEIKDSAIRQKVLTHLQAAERGLFRAKAARDQLGQPASNRILKSLRLASIDQVDNLKTLHELLVELETATAQGI